MPTKTDATATAKPRLRRLPDTTSRETSRPGQTVTLKHYEVSVGGKVLGTVDQHRARTMTPYAGQMYGHESYRTCWEWTAEIGGGDSELDTRGQAVGDLVDYATDLT